MEATRCLPAKTAAALSTLMLRLKLEVEEGEEDGLGNAAAAASAASAASGASGASIRLVSGPPSSRPTTKNKEGEGEREREMGREGWARSHAHRTQVSTAKRKTPLTAVGRVKCRGFRVFSETRVARKPGVFLCEHIRARAASFLSLLLFFFFLLRSSLRVGRHQSE